MRKLLVILTSVLFVVALVALGLILGMRNEAHEGHLDSKLGDVEQPSGAQKATSFADFLSNRNLTADEKRIGRATCWKTYGRNAARGSDGSDLKLGTPHSTLWQIRIGSLMEFPPSFCNGFVYVNSAAGDTYAINAVTGKIYWKVHSDRGFDTTPAIAGDRIIVAGLGGRIRAIDRATGKSLWKLRVRSAVESSPVVKGRFIYIGSLDGRVYAINVETGRVRWAYKTSGEIKSSLTLYQGKVFATNYAGEIIALRQESGRLVWRREFRLDPLRTERIYSSAPAARNTIYFVTVGG